MDTFPGSYLSRVVDLPVAIAEILFDDATQSLGPAARSEPPPVGTSMLPVRRVRMRLHGPLPWAGVPVEIELMPWSRSRTEIGVRYGGKRIPRSIRLYVYETEALRLLDDVTGDIQARIPGTAAKRRAA
jgi:hypothetical protein